MSRICKYGAGYGLRMLVYLDWWFKLNFEEDRRRSFGEVGSVNEREVK